MKAPPAALLACALLAGCRSGTGSPKDELVAADKALSALAAQRGPKAAITATMSSDLKILDQYNLGSIGLRESFRQQPDDVQISWEPAFVDAASGGDLGYTWGRYQLVLPSIRAKGQPYTERGYYVNIWKRELGQWRLVFTGLSRDRGQHPPAGKN